MKKIVILEYWDSQQPIDQRQKRWELEEQKEYSIGRSPHSDIFIQHPSISRKHVIIKVSQSGNITLQDCQSANGTFIDGKRVKEDQTVVLRKGNKIILGECPNELTINEQLVKNKKEEKQKTLKVEIDSSQSKQNSRSRSRSQEKQEKKEKSQEKCEQVPVQQKKIYENKFNSQSQNQYSSQGSQNTQSSYQGNNNNKLAKNEIQQKRALLWSKDTKVIDEKKQYWNNVQANNQQKNKFMKLLGVKEKPDNQAFVIKSAQDALNKDKVQEEIEKQFYQGVFRKGMAKSGLGMH